LSAAKRTIRVNKKNAALAKRGIPLLEDENRRAVNAQKRFFGKWLAALWRFYNDSSLISPFEMFNGVEHRQQEMTT
jgi:hypothetical protein